MSARPSHPLLDLHGLRISRGRTTILAGLDWTVRRGEHWVILGSNGAGKSSLLAALTGYLTPSGGEIEVLGRHFGRSDWRELREHIGLVGAGMQRLIDPSTTAFETVLGGYRAMINPWGRFPALARRRAHRLLRRDGLAAIADRPWQQLSEGERQRTLLARAQMAHPRLLILDEPCAGLDPVAREAFLTSLARLARARGGPGLVLVTHHVEEIVPGFTHALLLREGTVLAAGPLGRTLTAAKLTAAFDHPVRVHRRAGRWQLRVVAPAAR
ncbi:MAG TPA: ATP-binding cassette domain-containing protein [Opitutaceae bacterium]|nr:ATP-binding cassette domain-containing protein [Opitutaceae bacterium]